MTQAFATTPTPEPLPDPPEPTQIYRALLRLQHPKQP
jgi:hypothetical protein